MIEKKITSKLSECVIYTYTPTTQNLDEICVLLEKEGKTYAEYQKDQYKRFYDVKTGIEDKIEMMHYKGQERERKKLCDKIHEYGKRWKK